MSKQRTVPFGMGYDRTYSVRHELNEQGLDVNEDIPGKLQENMSACICQSKDFVLRQELTNSLIKPDLGPGKHRQFDAAFLQFFIQHSGGLMNHRRARAAFKATELVGRRHNGVHIILHQHSAKRNGLLDRFRSIIKMWQTMAVRVHELLRLSWG